MTSFISFKVVQFYTSTCLIELCFTQKTSGFQESKEGDNAILKVPAVHCTAEDWGGGAGYGISMGLEYFQKFLDKPMQREGDFGGH